MQHLNFNSPIRNLIIKHSENTNEIMVNIVTAFEDSQALRPLVDKLVDNVKNIKSIVNNITSKKAGVSNGEYEINLYGENVIRETINGMTFNISANSFFQTNTRQTEKLYSKLITSSKAYSILKGLDECRYSSDIKTVAVQIKAKECLG